MANHTPRKFVVPVALGRCLPFMAGCVLLATIALTCGGNSFAQAEDVATVEGFKLSSQGQHLNLALQANQPLKTSTQTQADGSLAVVIDNAKLSPKLLSNGLPVTLDNHAKYIARLLPGKGNTVKVMLPNTRAQQESLSVNQAGVAQATDPAPESPTLVKVEASPVVDSPAPTLANTLRQSEVAPAPQAKAPKAKVTVVKQPVKQVAKAAPARSVALASTAKVDPKVPLSLRTPTPEPEILTQDEAAEFLVDNNALEPASDLSWQSEVEATKAEGIPITAYIAMPQPLLESLTVGTAWQLPLQALSQVQAQQAFAVLEATLQDKVQQGWQGYLWFWAGLGLVGLSLALYYAVVTYRKLKAEGVLNRVLGKAEQAVLPFSLKSVSQTPNVHWYRLPAHLPFQPVLRQQLAFATKPTLSKGGLQAPQPIVASFLNPLQAQPSSLKTVYGKGLSQSPVDALTPEQAKRHSASGLLTPSQLNEVLSPSLNRGLPQQAARLLATQLKRSQESASIPTLVPQVLNRY